jgi:glutamine amidotransferase
MQLMTRGSEEGRRPGLGWIDAHTVHIKKDAGEGARHLKVPHIGWNFIEPVRAHALLQDLPEDPRFYFVHTYKAVCASRDDVLAETDYGDGRFTSAFAAGNLAGVQFHPEKSHLFGMQLFRNFAAWQGATAREAARG